MGPRLSAQETICVHGFRVLFYLYTSGRTHCVVRTYTWYEHMYVRVCEYRHVYEFAHWFVPRSCNLRVYTCSQLCMCVSVCVHLNTRVTDPYVKQVGGWRVKEKIC